MLSFVISVALMLAVVSASVHWAVRKQRRLESHEEGHARDHR